MAFCCWKINRTFCIEVCLWFSYVSSFVVLLNSHQPVTYLSTNTLTSICKFWPLYYIWDYCTFRKFVTDSTYRQFNVLWCVGRKSNWDNGSLHVRTCNCASELSARTMHGSGTLSHVSFLHSFTLYWYAYIGLYNWELFIVTYTKLYIVGC